MTENNRSRPDGQLTQAYDRMLERVRGTLDRAEQTTLATLRARIDDAVEKAVELGELSSEEAERTARYLERDLVDAGEFLAETGGALGDWLRFDLQLIEHRLLEMFQQVADQTRLGILQFEQGLRSASEYRTGEVTGIGTLRCAACGKQMQFVKTGHIPPCPQCHGTVFTRVAPEGGGEAEAGC